MVPVSGDASLHAMADAHCQFMSTDGKRPRRAFVGGPLGEKTTTLTELPRAGHRAEQRPHRARGPGREGLRRLREHGPYPPYIAAAQLAGLQSGLDEIGDSITFKAVKATGLEWTPSMAELRWGSPAASS